MVMTYLGGTIGQKLLGTAAIETQSLFLVIGIFLVVSIIPVSMTRSIRPSLPKPQQTRFKTILRKSPLGLAGCFTAGLTNSDFYAMGPVFSHQAFQEVSKVSWFMSLTLLGGLCFQWPVGALSDRMDRSLMLPFLRLALASVSLGIFFICQSSFDLFLGATVVFGGLMFTIYPVAVARAHDMFEPQDVVKVSSVLLLAFGVGAVIGPMACSTVMTLAGTPYGYYYYYIGVACLFSVTALVWRRIMIVKPVPTEDQVDFVIMEHTSQVASHMDPRLEDPNQPASKS